MHYLVYIVGGIVSIGFGISVLIDGGYSNLGIWVGGRLPGIAAIVFGIVSFCMVPKAIKLDEKKTKHGKTLKCPECGMVFRYEEANDLKCTVCSAQLENLSGFFQRHPNFNR